MRVVAVKVDADGTHVVAYVTRADASQVLPDLESNGQTALVFARPLQESDFEPLYAAASDPLIWELHPQRDRYKREVFETYFRTGIESRGALLLTDASGEVIGCSRYHDYRPGESQVEIGYTFLIRRCWGGEHNRELKRLMLDHAYRHVETVVFVVGEKNLRSRRAVEKLGARLTAPTKQGSVTYRLQNADWRP
ncbi:MAG: GNAT family N-acetyltransferase [Elusimicrobia bacterium]|nr:GNAT family N-acetyltransferase [Elusimicrobiota bacterium]